MVLSAHTLGSFGLMKVEKAIGECPAAPQSPSGLLAVLIVAREIAKHINYFQQSKWFVSQALALLEIIDHLIKSPSGTSGRRLRCATSYYETPRMVRSQMKQDWPDKSSLKAIGQEGRRAICKTTIRAHYAGRSEGESG